MKLPALALFERTLRLETRSALMGWTRAGLLAIILFILVPLHRLSVIGRYSAAGLNFLEQMAWVNFVFITLAGLGYFASSITEEKEEMMLGLLRMTDLNGVAILLGKSTSRLVGAILLLLVQVPFVLLAVTLGGVGLAQIAAAYATLLAYVFFLCNLAMLFSVVFRNTATAAVFTLFSLCIFLFGCYWARDIERSIGLSYNVDLQRGVWPAISSIIDYWESATPTARLGAIFLSGFTGPILHFQVWSNLAMGILSFVAAWALFDRFTREEKDAAPVFRWRWGKMRRQSRIPPHLVGAHAITWKDFTFVSGGRFGLIVKFLIAGLLVAVLNWFAVDSRGSSTISLESEGWTLIWVSILCTAIWLALEASRIFRDEVRWKTLSALMTLPISVRELAYRKVAGVLVGTLPLLAGAVIGFILIPQDKIAEFFKDLMSDPVGIGVMVVGVLQFVLFLHLTAFLSLVIRRGALALAIGIQYLGGSMCIGCASPFLFVGGGFREGSACFFLSLVCIVLTLVLHYAIGYRLERAAAQE